MKAIVYTLIAFLFLNLVGLIAGVILKNPWLMTLAIFNMGIAVVALPAEPR